MDKVLPILFNARVLQELIGPSLFPSAGQQAELQRVLRDDEQKAATFNLRQPGGEIEEQMHCHLCVCGKLPRVMHKMKFLRLETLIRKMF